MAYVVTRRNERFEIRESLHTPRGPRAHTLAGFSVLTDEVLTKAAKRARRPFDPLAVLASGQRAGAPVARTVTAVKPIAGGQTAPTGSTPMTGTEPSRPASRFVEASRRMAATLGRPPTTKRRDPGAALIELLGFADAVTSGRPTRPAEPLAFPALSRLVRERRAPRSHRLPAVARG